MTRPGQRGMTLIELIVAIAVTSIVFVGLASVLYTASYGYQNWIDRVSTASLGSPLAAALQADSHRYVPCNGIEQHLPRLEFCLPNDDANPPRVRYVIDPTGPPYSISRQDLGPAGATVLMARSTGSVRPVFWFDCRLGSGTVSGHIHLYGFRPVVGNDKENFSVYYRAPWQQRSDPNRGCT